MITDEVLEIPRINPPQTADFDRSQRPVLDAAAHGFLVDVQDFRRFSDSAERVQLLHGVSSLMPVLLRSVLSTAGEVEIVAVYGETAEGLKVEPSIWGT